ncbi:MAG: antirestriction protein ArdC [Bosea sp. 12-68-7]|nr:MAG: antirestriction protein ArdC [Bosea sp. 12-68-7]OYW98951.1 MAG: antirestriction protein ArdC [Bosea sp. 32-68-6]
MDLHQTITDRILAALETADPKNWQCPWHRRGGGLPVNAKSGKSYRGINVLSLWVADQVSGFGDSRWATYRQWSELGAQVRKGEKSSLVVFYKDYEAADENGDPERRMVAKASFAFNASQVEGAPAAETLPAGGFEPIEVAEATIQATGARIDHVGDSACYIPSMDLVRMPPRDRFVSADGYYSTIFHELGHWTGAKGRLDRNLSGRFKSQAYAGEELIAELTAAFVTIGLGLASEPHAQTASYIASWIKLLRDDKRALFTAAAAASKAADYLTRATG